MTTLTGREGRTEPAGSRIEDLKPHPAALLIHRPTEAEYQALKASITDIGVVNPVITVWEGMCLDGNTRLRACRELGLVHLLVIRHFDPDIDGNGDPYEYAKAQNEHRRHLSEGQRIQIDQRVEAAVALRDQGLTYGEIAEKLGVSEPTARRLIRRGDGGVKAHEGDSDTSKESTDGPKRGISPGQSATPLSRQGGDDSESAGQGPAGPRSIINKRGQRRPATYAPRKPRATTSKAQPRRIKPRAKTPSTPAPKPTDEPVEEEALDEVDVGHPAPQSRRPPDSFTIQEEQQLLKLRDFWDDRIRPSIIEYIGNKVAPAKHHSWLRDIHDDIGSLLGE